MNQQPIWNRIVSVSSQVAELSVFAAAAAVLAFGMMRLR
jgi:hypothetical protein